MVASLKEHLNFKTNKYFKARDYHEIEFVLQMNDEILSKADREATNDKIRILYLVANYGWYYALRMHKNEKVKAAGFVPPQVVTNVHHQYQIKKTHTPSF